MKTAQRDNRVLFAEALTEALSRKYEAALSSAITASPSEAYHAKVRQTILKARSEAFRKRLLTALLAATLLLLVSCTAVYCVHADFGYFSTEDDGVSVHIFYDEATRLAAPKILEEYYVPKHLPDGFIKQEELFFRDDSVIYIYKNAEGKQFQFSQVAFGGTSSYSHSVSSSYTTWETVTIEGQEFLCGKHDWYDEVYATIGHIIYFKYLWCDGRYLLSITSDVPLSTEELALFVDEIEIVPK